MRVEWRRDEPQHARGATDENVAALPHSLRDEIVQRGPISFERFMDRALYDPAHGYYATTVTRPTRAGDFLTAPELHPIFGRTVARQVDEMWRRLGRPNDFVVREYGAGSGALFLSVLDGLVRMESPLAAIVRYDPIDFARQRALIQDELAAAGREQQLVHIADDHKLSNAVVIGNEYLDALPVQRVIKLNGELREIRVDWRDERFTEVAGPITNDRVAAWFVDRHIELAEGQRAEVNLHMLDWVKRISRELARGYVVLFDYGAAAAALYDQSRPSGTIRAFSEQRVSGDVLSEPGSRDITSHVDFDALEEQARACGLEVAGRRRSNAFLVACGLDEVYAQARAESERDWDAAVALRSAVTRLLDTNALGGYLVSVLYKDAPNDPPLIGLGPIEQRR
jgi:SAM-dependent MidA family methyltransferase